MLVNGKMSYKEIEQLVFILKEKVVNSYLKNIYHYNGLWMFKFNHFSFVYEPGMAIWPGEFAERETNRVRGPTGQIPSISTSTYARPCWNEHKT